MYLPSHYVVDTTAIVSAYKDIFNEEPKISEKAINIINRAIYAAPEEIILHIPSVVFVEIARKWGKNREIAANIYYTIFRRMKDAENVEIVGIEKEVLENIINVDDDSEPLETHDKIIIATAMMYQYKIITSDEKIIRYANGNVISLGVLR